MTKKAKWVFNILFFILSFAYLLALFLLVYDPGDKFVDDIWGSNLDWIFVCMFGILFLLSEIGIYTGLSYFLFQPKSTLITVWNAVKILFSFLFIVMVFLCCFGLKTNWYPA